MFNILYRRSTANCMNKLQIFYRTLSKHTKPTNFASFRLYYSSFNNAYKSEKQKICDKPENKLLLNANLKNNVILYKYENPRYFITFKVFCLGWAFLASIMLYFSFDQKFIYTWKKTTSWKDYLTKNGTNLLYFIYAVVVGPTTLMLLYIVHKKFIKYIILHKGGKDISLVTHHLLKHEHVYTFPLNHVQSTVSRLKMKEYIPIKIKGKKLYYLLDREGTFLNEELFDLTFGTAKFK